MRRGHQHRFLAIGAVILAASGSASAAGEEAPVIEASVSAKSVGLGEVFELLITIVTKEEQPTEVKLPDLDDFEIVSQSVSSPVQFSFGFGTGGGGMKASYTREHDIWLKSKKPGRYEIGPVEITWKGKAYSGRKISVTVTNTPPKQTSVPQPASPFPDMDWPFKMPGFPQPPQPVAPVVPPVQPPDDAGTGGGMSVEVPATLDGAQYDPQMFLQTVVEPQEAYIGQQVTMTLLLYSSVNLVGSIDIPTEPGTDKFWVKDLLPPSSKISFTSKVVQGKSFEVGLLRRLAIFPTEAGTVTVAPATVKTTAPLGGMLGGGDYTRTGVPVDVVVKPLPAEGQPAGFDPAAVGSFTFDGSLEPEQVFVNQPAKYTLVIKGTGNMELMKAPSISLPEGVKTYDPQITDLVSLKGGVVGGSKRIEYMLIPTKDGDLTVGPVAWSWFDPAEGAYRKSVIPAKTVKVLPSGQPVGQADTTDLGGDGVAQAEEQYRQIRTVAALEKAGTQIVRTPWFLAAVIFPPGVLAVLYLVLLGRSISRGMRNRNPAGRALKEARALLRQAGGEGDPGSFYAGVQRAIYLYLERRFRIPATGMTGPELMAALLRLGVDRADADPVVRETENCEFARYGVSASDRSTDMAAVQARVLETLSKLERYEPPPPAPARGDVPAALLVIAVAGVLGAIVPSAQAETVQDMFAKGNEQYWKGSYRDAVNAYYGIMNLGIEDTDLWYNTGTAYARMGEFGRAAFFLEKVLRERPRDTAAQHNVALARSSVARELSKTRAGVDLTPRETLWQGMLLWFTPNELALLFLIFYYAFFAALFARRLAKSPVGKVGASVFIAIFLVLWVAGGAMLTGKYQRHFLTHEAVVLEEGIVMVREGPDPQSPRLFDVIEAQRVVVVGTSGEWVHVRDDRGRDGWLTRAQLGML